MKDELGYGFRIRKSTGHGVFLESGIGCATFPGAKTVRKGGSDEKQEREKRNGILQCHAELNKGDDI